MWDSSKDVKGSIPREEIKMTKTGYSCMVASLSLIISFFLISCVSGPKSPTMDSDWTDIILSGEDWYPLQRPSSAWKPGTVAEVKKGKVEDLGNIFRLNCFPENAIMIDKDEGGELQFHNKVTYGFLVSATIGLNNDELIKAGISVNDDLESGKSPQHQSLFTIEKSAEQTLDYILLEDFIRKNFSQMPTSCQVNLKNPNRAIVNKVFIITKRTLMVTDNNGAKIDLSTPKFGNVVNGMLKAGYKVDKSGKITFSEDSAPIPVAVRCKRFDEAIKHNLLYYGSFDTSDRN